MKQALQILILASILWLNIFAVTHTSDGNKLFIAKCSMCHATSKAIVGPPFQYIRKDYEWTFVTAIIRNHDAVLSTQDMRAVYLNLVWNKTRGVPVYDSLSDNDISAILDYVDSFPKSNKYYQHRKMSDKERESLINKINDDTNFNIDKHLALLDSLKQF